MGSTVLKVNQLETTLNTSDGISRIVDGIDLELKKGQVLGLVGESGSGKTITALSIMRLIADPPWSVSAKHLSLNQTDLLSLSEDQFRSYRGKHIAMIFQEPMTSLNPVFTVGNQVSEMLWTHMKMSRKEALERTVELLHLVGIPSPRQRAKEYPHQLSGGMRQRIMIAMAISCNPEVIIADEPTTALDVTIQAQILDLLEKLREQFGMALLLISHDLGVIAEISHEVAIMYAGRIVERTSTKELFLNPLHPYTQGLLSSLPSFDQSSKSSRLQAIPGSMPKPLELPVGCKFEPRCPHAFAACRDEPALEEIDPGHWVRCWWARDNAGKEAHAHK